MLLESLLTSTDCLWSVKNMVFFKCVTQQAITIFHYQVASVVWQVQKSDLWSLLESIIWSLYACLVSISGCFCFFSQALIFYDILGNDFYTYLGHLSSEFLISQNPKSRKTSYVIIFQWNSVSSSPPQAIYAFFSLIYITCIYLKSWSHPMTLCFKNSILMLLFE